MPGPFREQALAVPCALTAYLGGWESVKWGGGGEGEPMAQESQLVKPQILAT